VIVSVRIEPLRDLPDQAVDASRRFGADAST
jgi:hypothetical protein